MELVNNAAQRVRIREVAEKGLTGRLRHCLAVGVEIRGPADEAELRRRLNRLVVQHPALASVFTDRDTHHPAGGTPGFRRQFVDRPDAPARWRAANSIAALEAERPFAVGEHPLFRGILLTAEPDRHLLVLTLDPLVCDAWSVNLVVSDLLADDDDATSDAYQAVWLERENWLAGPGGQAALGRRGGALADAWRRWPIAVTWDAPEHNEAVERFIAMDDEITHGLRARVRQSRSSLLAVGSAALAIGLVDDPLQPLALRSTFAARETVAEQSAVGSLASSGVIRLPPRVGSIHEHVTGLRNEIFAALADQRAPYELLEDVLPPGPANGPSCAMVFLPKELSGGRQSDWRLGKATATRTAVSICPTGADVDLFLIEDAPPMGTAPRAALTLGASSWRGAGRSEVDHLLEQWTTALRVLAVMDWTTPIADAAARVMAGPTHPAGVS